MKKKKRSEPIKTDVGGKRVIKRHAPTTLQTSPGHKERFNQLLDDVVVIGFKK